MPAMVPVFRVRTRQDDRILTVLQLSLPLWHERHGTTRDVLAERSASCSCLWLNAVKHSKTIRRRTLVASTSKQLFPSETTFRPQETNWLCRKYCTQKEPGDQGDSHPHSKSCPVSCATYLWPDNTYLESCLSKIIAAMDMPCPSI